MKLPPKSRSPSHAPMGTPSAAVDSATNSSPGSGSRRISSISGASNDSPQDNLSPQLQDLKATPVDAQQESSSAGLVL